jgi:excisionase family DNA binding protein
MSFNQRNKRVIVDPSNQHPARAERIFENFLTKNALAEALSVSTSFIDKLMSKGGLPYYKLGRAVRFRLSEVASFLDRRRSS